VEAEALTPGNAGVDLMSAVPRELLQVVARPPFDWRNPDHSAIFRDRVRRLAKIRAEPDRLPVLKAYYRDNPAQFID